jgi:GntR family transcriptional regulator
MPVDPHSHVPIYEQIVEHVRGAVVAGLYRPDEPLPSIRAMALELVVNPNTVQRAYQELERQGLVYMRRGLGVFVAKNGNASAQHRLDDAVYARFAQAIQVGRAANMSADSLEAIFHKAMRGAGGSERRAERREPDANPGRRSKP